MKELISKGGHLGFEMQEPDEKEKADRVGGLGFESKGKNGKDEKKINSEELNKIGGVGLDDLKYLDQ